MGIMALPKARVRCLPNPSVFYINELVVGVTTADSLGDIKSEEMVTRIEASSTSVLVKGESVASKNKETNTRFTRSILSQRSFYPLFPPPTSTFLSYDTSHSHLLNFPAVTPDLLIFPSSKLSKPFIRVVSSATVIQPGLVAGTGGGGGGSVACIQINPMQKIQLERLERSDTVNSKLYDRARIDIVTL